MYIFRQNGPTDGKIETMITVDSMFCVHFLFLFGCLHTSIKDVIVVFQEMTMLLH